MLWAMLKRPPCSGAIPSSIPHKLLAGVAIAGGDAAAPARFRWQNAPG